VPENISPDCQDVAFAPGEVSSRPAVQVIFNPALETNSTIVYGKSFKLPSGAIKNLYYSSTGKFYVEDVLNTPGTATLLFTSTPGSYCKSITAFGREYIAISDGLHGTEVPLQYDGTLLRRVTGDGPGSPPAVTSLAYPTVALAASSAPTTVAVVSSTPTIHTPFFGSWVHGRGGRHVRRILGSCLRWDVYGFQHRESNDADFQLFPVQRRRGDRRNVLNWWRRRSDADAAQ
jgi:hypothetical protein